MNELTKTVAQVAGAAVATNALIKRLAGKALDEAGEWLATEVRIRLSLPRNLKLLGRVKQICEEYKIKPAAVNLKVLLPLLESSAVEDDETMAERWASLLASAADPKNSTHDEVAFIGILKELPPAHAYLLDVYYEQVERAEWPREVWNENGFSMADLKVFLKEEVPEFDVALQNLLRLRLVALPTIKIGVANGQPVRVQLTSSGMICPTSLGQAFARACGRGRTPRDKAYGLPYDSVANIYSTDGLSVRLWSKAEEVAWKKKGYPEPPEPL